VGFNPVESISSTLIQIHRTTIELVQGDLTELHVDAIVNAANRELQLGSGVAGAIRMKGGPTIQAECDAQAPIATGEAVLTGGGRLPARYVIHAVGPRYGEEEAEEKLAEATRRSLAVAEGAGLRSIAFPAISTGVYRFPIARAAEIMLGTILAYVQPGSHLERIVCCLFDAEALGVYKRALAALAPEGDAAEGWGRGEESASPAGGAAGERVLVRARFFAATREAAGREEVELALPARATAGEALAELVARYPALRGHAASLRLAVNLAYVEPRHPLRDGDELALIPPTCGG
jgi:molybdopterin converting factor subunit 1